MINMGILAEQVDAVLPLKPLTCAGINTNLIN